MLDKFQTLLKLGLLNIMMVAFYRIKVRIGFFRQVLPIGIPIEGIFFSENGDSHIFGKKKELSSDATELLNGKVRFFSDQLQNVGSPPNWFHSLTEQNKQSCAQHWSKISDFQSGDIKQIWELSRFNWLVLAAQAYNISADKQYLTLMNHWVKDWSQKNPINKGYNWKCGQEASIRLINLLSSSFILGEYRIPSSAFIKMIKEHCNRILPTLSYAIAQDNNHGTSEAAALFIAGAWLYSLNDEDKKAEQLMRRGREGLEERVSRLVAKDGSFSQHSVNYHRLLLDTLSLVEFWCLVLSMPKFSNSYYISVNAAINWLRQVVDPTTGEAPNLGANDGAMLLQLSTSNYRDFRPTLQLAGGLFMDKLFYTYKGANEILEWLHVEIENKDSIIIERESSLLDCGGYATFVGDSCWGIIRYPHFRFRPSHADFLHLEVMDKGASIICDGGTYSYNTERRWLNYFSGIESHNTIQFDGGESMTRLSRFLFGSWADIVDMKFERNDGTVRWSGGYTDFRGCSHYREVELRGREWKILDNIDGFKSKAVMRWRLAPSDWVLQGNHVSSELGRLFFKVHGTEIKRISIKKGWESRYYSKMTELQVLEVEVTNPCQIETVISLAPVKHQLQ